VFVLNVAGNADYFGMSNLFKRRYFSMSMVRISMRLAASTTLMLAV